MRALSIPSPPSEWAQYPIGPFTLRAYALCLLVGIVVAFVAVALYSRFTTRPAV